MTTTLGEIRTKITDQLKDSVAGVSFYPRLPVRFQTPAGWLRRTIGPTWRTFNGVATVGFELVVIVDSRLGERASEVLDGLVEATGVGSIRGALEDGPTLGGIAKGLTVFDWGEEEVIAVNDVDYPASVLGLEVYYQAE